MREVWSIADSIVSPLGITTKENFDRVVEGVSGINLVDDVDYATTPFYAATIKDLSIPVSYTRFEFICETAIRRALENIALAGKTLFILSTTKGNIELLGSEKKSRSGLPLHATAKLLADTFGFDQTMVISNACISGVLALQVAKKYIEEGQVDHAVIVGADVVSPFIVSGFKSLHALSDEPCRPFDLSRKGINLGEAAAVMVLSSKPEVAGRTAQIRLAGSCVTNDANHISGPSRTGDELAFAIRTALEQSNLTINDIDFISAHGTATLYNDEMEAKAFSLLGMSDIPVNSLKGYYGHTLGAAGILETIISMQSMLHGQTVATKGFDTLGVSQAINVCHSSERKSLKTILKTASGFGGCNAALVLQLD